MTKTADNLDATATQEAAAPAPAPTAPPSDKPLPLHVLNEQAKAAWRGARDDAHLIGQAAENAAAAVMAGATFNRNGKRVQKPLRPPPA